MRQIRHYAALGEAHYPRRLQMIDDAPPLLAIRGNADVLSFYTAQGNLAQKRIDIVKLKQQLSENWVALELAYGGYLPREQATSTQPAEGRP